MDNITFLKSVYKLLDNENIREKEYNEVCFDVILTKIQKELLENNSEIIELYFDSGYIVANIDNVSYLDYRRAIFLCYYFDLMDIGGKETLVMKHENVEYLIDNHYNILRVNALFLRIKYKFSIKDLVMLGNWFKSERIKGFLKDIKEAINQNANLLIDYKPDGKIDIEFEKYLHEVVSEIDCAIINMKCDELNNGELPIDFSNVFDKNEEDDCEKVESVAEGFLMSMRQFGKVDIQYISKITDKDIKTVVMELGDSIYQNPEKFNENIYDGYETSDEYLSGNLMNKYKIAKSYNEKYKGYFERNVKALKKQIDSIEKVEDFNVSLGARWIPTSVLAEFYFVKVLKQKEKQLKKNLDSLLFKRYDHINKDYDRDSVNKSYYSEANLKIPVSSYVRFGFTNNDYKNNQKVYKEISPLEIFANLIVGKQSYVRYYNTRDKKYVTDEEATLIVREKEQNMEDDFVEFAHEKKIFDELTKIYNEKFVYYKTRVYNGNFLEFKDKNSNLKLYDYQKNAIARILLSNNTLLAHNVGSGKTYIMICAGMELKKIGISNKNLYVVPNNIVEQWKSMFDYAYPSSNVFLITPKLFNKDHRKVLSDIRDKDFDVIIMAYSSFDRIKIKSEEKIIDKNEIYFEDLGINTLFLDEAHNYKNVPIKTSLKNIKGINIAGSKKCHEMMIKCNYIQKENNGRGIVFATGTPITNSISDIYNMQKYLQLKELELVGIDNFDAWRSMFAKVVSNFEVDIDSSNYRLANRLSEYYNVTELVTILSEVLDYGKARENENLIPKCDGRFDVTINKSKELDEYIGNISERIDKVRNRLVPRNLDNMLKITVDGRKAALDMRIVDNNIVVDDSCKISECVKKVISIYLDTIDKHSTQIIFCDISVSNSYSNVKNKTFTVYDELKRQLTYSGIPAYEIAFIHDATTEKEKQKMYDDFNAGNIRVLIGSTYKLGMGVNVQKKLIAIHHLDVPWRPSDMTQREGRILREGNENEKVYIYRYITKGSFDAYSWQLLETKQRFINQIISKSIRERKVSEIDDVVLNYAEAKALACNNPLMKNKFELTNEIERIELEKRIFENSKRTMKEELDSIPQKLTILSSRINKLKKDLETKAKEYDNVRINAEEKEKLESEIYYKLNENLLSNKEVPITKYKGFDLIVPTGVRINSLIIILKGKGEYYAELGTDKTAFLDKINKLINSFEEMYERDKSDRLKYEHDIPVLKQKIKEEFKDEEKLEKLKEELEKINKDLGDI